MRLNTRLDELTDIASKFKDVAETKFNEMTWNFKNINDIQQRDIMNLKSEITKCAPDNVADNAALKSAVRRLELANDLLNKKIDILTTNFADFVIDLKEFFDDKTLIALPRK